jgi:hypothetical protein
MNVIEVRNAMCKQAQDECIEATQEMMMELCDYTARKLDINTLDDTQRVMIDAIDIVRRSVISKVLTGERQVIEGIRRKVEGFPA